MVCLLVCGALFAQDANKVRDALEWTVALRGRMAQMSNPVVRVHGIASVARLVCPLDPVAASGLFRDAITSLFNIANRRFRRTRHHGAACRQLLRPLEIRGSGRPEVRPHAVLHGTESAGKRAAECRAHRRQRHTRPGLRDAEPRAGAGQGRHARPRRPGCRRSARSRRPGYARHRPVEPRTVAFVRKRPRSLRRSFRAVGGLRHVGERAKSRQPAGSGQVPVYSAEPCRRARGRSAPQEHSGERRHHRRPHRHAQQCESRTIYRH